MALVSMQDINWGFGDPLLLEKITFQIEKGERIGLLGRNGVGKSTMLKLLAGTLAPDSGTIQRQQGITVTALQQDVPHTFQGTAFEVAAQGVGTPGRTLAAYHRKVHQPDDDSTGLEQLQHAMDTEDGWHLLRHVEHILSRVHIDPHKPFAGLSAGMKRRTLFARALVMPPDILLLDEPTNHLDIETIDWMETYIRRHIPTLLFVTHDRAFLAKIATRIVELDRGRLNSYTCSYVTYLKRRQAELDVEAKQAHRFKKKLSQEEAWIRQGIKARRTRNEGRVRALKKMRDAYHNRRHETGNVNLQIQQARKTGKLVIEARNIAYGYTHTAPLIHDFSTAIMRGEKIGILGPNGVGKTTLLNLLLKDLTPTAGNVRHGTHLQVAYGDQLRDQLDEQKTVAANIGNGNDHIIFNNQKRHVIGYLQDFLFPPERSRTPVHILSGGEKNRLLLAKLFTRPANVLVLDEPTNDLDIETLELLEELLFNYTGTVLLVSHDRAFINNVVTRTIVFEGNGRLVEYAGGYDDWLQQRPQPEVKERLANAPKAGKPPPLRRAKPRRLSYMQQRELESLPQTIDTLEAEQRQLCERMAQPDFYKQAKDAIAADTARLKDVEQAIETAYRRWEELESITGPQT